MSTSFEELFDQLSEHCTSKYLVKQGKNCKDYQELLKREDKINKKIVKQLHQKELAGEQEEIFNAIMSYYQKWTYQKAFYDYTVLLHKMGILSMSADNDRDFSVDEETYYKLCKAAKKKGVTLEELVRQCCNYSLTHLEEMLKEEKRENK